MKTAWLPRLAENWDQIVAKVMPYMCKQASSPGGVAGRTWARELLGGLRKAAFFACVSLPNHEKAYENIAEFKAKQAAFQTYRNRAQNCLTQGDETSASEWRSRARTA